MINKLKTIAVAMLVIGATMPAANAKVVPIATNVIQGVTVTLTAYEEKAGTSNTIASGTFKTANILAAVESSLTNTFSKKATLSLLTSNLVTQTGTTNQTTNEVGNVLTAVDLSTNTYALYSETITISNGAPILTNFTTNNVTIGDTAGSYYVTLTATNGTTNVLVTSVGFAGPSTTGVVATNLTLDANQTLAIGTNAAVATETNLAFGGTPEAVDATSLSVTTNGVAVSNSPIVIGTNSLTISNTAGNVTVTVGTNVLSATNSATITNEVLIGSTVIISNGTSLGLGTTNVLSTSLTTSFTIATNSTSSTNGLTALETNLITGTNVTVVTTATDYVTNTVTITNPVPVFTTNTSVELVVADQGTNTPIPTTTMSVSVMPNDILGETINIHTSAITGETLWTIDRLDLSATNATSTNDVLSMKLQGLVKGTFANVKVGKGTVAVTNQAWSDVSGYGTNNGVPIVLGGTISIAAPAEQLVP
jgi:hypothetical protein